MTTFASCLMPPAPGKDCRLVTPCKQLLYDEPSCGSYSVVIFLFLLPCLALRTAAPPLLLVGGHERAYLACHWKAALACCRYGHKGSLAYVGRDKAVMDVPAFGPIFGRTAGEHAALYLAFSGSLQSWWPPLQVCHNQCPSHVIQQRLCRAGAAVRCFPGMMAADGTLTGTGVMWKGFETYSQISFRNIALVSSDWLRTKIFGRDISKV